jgi:hypothetical protein
MANHPSLDLISQDPLLAYHKNTDEKLWTQVFYPLFKQVKSNPACFQELEIAFDIYLCLCMELESKLGSDLWKTVAKSFLGETVTEEKEALLKLLHRNVLYLGDIGNPFMVHCFSSIFGIIWS